MSEAPAFPISTEPASTVTVRPPERDVARVPWWLKIVLKMILSRLPLPYAWWRRLGVFRHGSLADDVQRRASGFLSHLGNYRQRCERPLLSVVELGPGDSVAAALWAKAHGAQSCWLIDVGRFAIDDPAHYHAVCAHIAEHGLPAPLLAAPGGIAAVLAATGAAYRTDVLAALAALPESSVDFLFSQAMLEHIPRSDVDHLLRESFRVLRPGGVCSHAIDLQDHLGGALNHLRFPAWLWEHPFVARSGFYTNRLRCGEICRMAQAAGFAVSIGEMGRWADLPTPRAAFDASFHTLSDEELCIAAFVLLLQKPPMAGKP